MHSSRSRFTRRDFLAAAGAVSAVAALGGCGRTGIGNRPLVSTQQLNVVNWPEYIDLGTITRIQSELNLTVDYREVYEDNVTGFDDLIAPVLTGAATPDYDIITPTFWVADRIIADGGAEPLPLEVIPNHVNIDPAYLINDWDRGSRFQMPWQGGMTGIAYDPALVDGEIESINDLFNSRLAGKVGLVGEMREAVGLAMLANGDDPSRPTPRTAQAGLDRIKRLVEQGHFAKIVFDDFVGFLADGTLAATMAWSGQAAALQADRPDLEFAIPVEGAISWFDTMIMPRGAQNYLSAALWMNWMYNPENAAEISAWNLYVCPVLGTQDVLRSRGGESAALAENPLVFPDADTRNRLFNWGTLDRETERSLEAEFDSLFAFFE